MGSLLGRVGGKVPVCHITYPVTCRKRRLAKRWGIKTGKSSGSEGKEARPRQIKAEVRLGRSWG